MPATKATTKNDVKIKHRIVGDINYTMNNGGGKGDNK